MYSFVPADEEAHKATPREPVFVPDEMVRSKTSLVDSGDKLRKKGTDNNYKCKICNKTYKNKKSLADHKRKFHSKIPLKLFVKQDKDASKSKNKSDDDSTMIGNTSRKRKISTDDETSNKNHIASYSGESSDSNNDKSDKRYRRPKIIQHSRPYISHPPKKRSISPDSERVIKKLKRKHYISHPPTKRTISPDSERVIKKLKRKHKEGSVRRKIRKNLEKRRRNKRKRLRRKLVIPKYVEPTNTDDEVDNVSDIYEPPETKNISENDTIVNDDKIIDDIDDIDYPADDSTSDESDVTDPSEHVNCVSVEDFENVRKSIKNYNAEAIFNDVNGLNIIKTLFKGILDGWIPICTSQKQMFSDNAITFMRKAQKSKIIDLHSLIRNNREELENIFKFVDKSIKLVVDSYNKFGITDDNGHPK